MVADTQYGTENALQSLLNLATQKQFDWDWLDLFIEAKDTRFLDLATLIFVKHHDFIPDEEFHISLKIVFETYKVSETQAYEWILESPAARQRLTSHEIQKIYIMSQKEKTDPDAERVLKLVRDTARSHKLDLDQPLHQPLSPGRTGLSESSPHMPTSSRFHIA